MIRLGLNLDLILKFYLGPKCLESDVGMFCCLPRQLHSFTMLACPLGAFWFDPLRYKGPWASGKRGLSSNPNSVSLQWFWRIFSSSLFLASLYIQMMYGKCPALETVPKNVVTSSSLASLLQNAVWWLFKDLPRPQEGRIGSGFNYWRRLLRQISEGTM